ncbi:MAG: hypothetical protein QXZ22_08225 [Sulfolobales archaeon]
MRYEDYLHLADVLVNDILVSTKEIDISEVKKMFGLNSRQLNKLIKIVHVNWRVYIRDGKLVLE